MRLWSAVLLAVFLVLAGCGGTPRWKERGFDSETECWRNHGWDGGWTGFSEAEKLDWWCG